MILHRHRLHLYRTNILAHPGHNIPEYNQHDPNADSSWEKKNVHGLSTDPLNDPDSHRNMPEVAQLAEDLENILQQQPVSQSQNHAAAERIIVTENVMKSIRLEALDAIVRVFSGH